MNNLERLDYWQHQPGDSYGFVVGSIVGNPQAGYECVYYLPEERCATIKFAWKRGLRTLDRSDDFNIGVWHNGQLVATLWGPDGEVVDDDPAVVAEIASGSVRL